MPASSPPPLFPRIPAGAARQAVRHRVWSPGWGVTGVPSLAISVTLHAALLGTAWFVALPAHRPHLQLSFADGDGVAIELTKFTVTPRRVERERPAPRGLDVVRARLDTGPWPSSPPGFLDRVSGTTPAPDGPAVAVAEAPGGSPLPEPALAPPVEPALSTLPEIAPVPEREPPVLPDRRGARILAAAVGRARVLYPRSCLTRRCTGTCVVQLSIDEAGKIDSVNLVSSAGCPDLDRAAVEALEKVVAEALAEGRILGPVSFVQPFVFELRPTIP